MFTWMNAIHLSNVYSIHTVLFTRRITAQIYVFPILYQMTILYIDALLLGRLQMEADEREGAFRLIRLIHVCH